VELKGETRTRGHIKGNVSRTAPMCVRELEKGRERHGGVHLEGGEKARGKLEGDCLAWVDLPAMYWQKNLTSGKLSGRRQTEMESDGTKLNARGGGLSLGLYNLRVEGEKLGRDKEKEGR